ncbi:MAG: Na(+)-translocating NADH-quinone reductase subunit A [Prevotellaceae bacterium]|jgi:Na+-transporting NADH:ubiquinone oxidoreductase subunit A|nr:Na(+)-translocating NADH-quinone reductase subunit A [Prevotellaceae bacterium]
MLKIIKLKKGLDIKLKGEPEKIFGAAEKPAKYALKPADFVGITPKLSVQEGDHVKIGSPLFLDKNRPEIKFVSPVSGTISAINRGEKRKLLSIVVTSDAQEDYIKHDVGEWEKMTREQIINIILESGSFPFFIQRPYGIIANPADIPKAVFVSCFDSSPLAVDYDFAMQYDAEYLKAGIKVLSKLTNGNVNLGISKKMLNSTIFNTEFLDIKNVVITAFAGKHPSGNAGVQINHVNPVNKGDIVWTVKLQHAVMLGKLFEKGIYDANKIVVLAGSQVERPCYYRIVSGAPVSIFAGQIKKENEKENRIISGNVLSGSRIDEDGYLGFYDEQICVIPEGNYYELFGWAKPFRMKKFSMSRSYFSWIMPDKKYELDTNYNGSVRAFVMNGQYEKVLPMNIYPVYLLKAILASDIDKMEQLGIYEVIEEDLALCEFVCTSKIDVQKILRDGIDLMIKEMTS